MDDKDTLTAQDSQETDRMSSTGDRDMLEMTGEELLAEMQELSMVTPLSPNELLGAAGAFNRLIFSSLFGEIVELRNELREMMNVLIPATEEMPLKPIDVSVAVGEFEDEAGMVQLIGLVGLLRSKQGSKLVVIGGD